MRRTPQAINELNRSAYKSTPSGFISFILHQKSAHLDLAVPDAKFKTVAEHFAANKTKSQKRSSGIKRNPR